MNEAVFNLRNRKFRVYLFAIACVFVLFYIIHGFAMFNNILVDDSLKYPEYYSSEARIELGRWFLSPACALGSFYDLRSVNGFLSCAYLALTVCIIIKLFKIGKYSSVFLISLLSVSFCTVGGMMLWLYTADGYMMSYLFSIAAAYLSVFDEYDNPELTEKLPLLKNKTVTSMLAVVLLCLSCGIYQAYISAYMTVIMMLFILRAANPPDMKVKNKSRTKKQNGNISWWLHKFAILAAAVILYFIIWRIVLAVSGIQASGQHGTNDIFNGTSFIPRFFNAFAESYKDLLRFLCYGSRMTIEGVFFVSAAVITLVLLIYFLIHEKIYTNKKKFIAILLDVAVLPLAFFYINFATDSSQYSGLMIMSMLIPVLFAVALIERYTDKQKLRSAAILILVMFGFVSAVGDNILYFDATVAFESTMSIGTELKLRIDDAIDDNDGVFPSKIVIIGKRVDAVKSRLAGDSIKSGTSSMDYLIRDSDIIHFLYYQYGYSFEQIYHPPFMDSLKSMADFPSRDSVRIVEDTLVIKLSDEKD
ncbi:MAG: glucosyltransferase domain-containing protein [Clostridia bacterium]|nr:glucosyltransferase domain-containing protein [Clostridia bacterium]